MFQLVLFKGVEMAKEAWDKAAKPESTTQILPIAYTIQEAVKATGISRTRLYEELKAGNLVAKKIGRRTLIPRDSIETWLNDLTDYNSGGQGKNTATSPQKKLEI
jgi:excisionase family DNA binding protein